jgi:hypothetical protein
MFRQRLSRTCCLFRILTGLGFTFHSRSTDILLFSCWFLYHLQRYVTPVMFIITGSGPALPWRNMLDTPGGVFLRGIQKWVLQREHGALLYNGGL